MLTLFCATIAFAGLYGATFRYLAREPAEMQSVLRR